MIERTGERNFIDCRHFGARRKNNSMTSKGRKITKIKKLKGKKRKEKNYRDEGVKRRRRERKIDPLLDVQQKKRKTREKKTDPLLDVKRKMRKKRKRNKGKTVLRGSKGLFLPLRFHNTWRVFSCRCLTKCP